MDPTLSRPILQATALFLLFFLPQLKACEEQQLTAGRTSEQYLMQDDLIIKVDKNTELSLLVVRPRAMTEPLPVALRFTIYAEQERSLDIAKACKAAKRGYIGVIAYARGKHLSRSSIVPYETEVDDVTAVINWLAKQTWSDGRVAMYGGSYEGFAQWAATKRMPAALKTIVPYVAAIPGQGLPMENNVFISANYGWPFHVTNNKYKDDSIYQQKDRWQNLTSNWYKSGKSYRELDSFDQQPNPWFQRWLQHPSYDSYWQAMVPYQQDFSRISIPVLTVTGYYDDGQISALHYLTEHYRYRPDAEHYLVIGPYDHWTAQTKAAESLRDMAVDPVARIDTADLTFAWLDYVLKGKTKPALLQDKINYQLPGSNSWRHVASLQKLNAASQTFYLSTATADKPSMLSLAKQQQPGSMVTQVDLADRSGGNSYYPWPIVTKQIEPGTGKLYISEVFSKETEFSGQFSAQLDVRTNKKDFDLSVVLYELQADGRYVHLAYYLGRASYAKDITKRQLLTPGSVESIPVVRSRMGSKLLKPGSRLVLFVNVNKNDFAQVNYGSGKDVSSETIADANEPLTVEWLNSSVVNIPLQQPLAIK